MYLQSVVRPRTLAANVWNLSPLPCLAEWAVARRIPTATGRTATVFTWLKRSAMLNDPMSWMALSAVLISSSEKQAMAWVVNCGAGMLHPIWNLDHLVRKSAHWAGEQPISTVGRTRAGGLRLGLRALGIWAGCSVATWFMMACMAAAGSRPTGAWNKHPPNTQARGPWRGRKDNDKNEFGGLNSESYSLLLSLTYLLPLIKTR